MKEAEITLILLGKPYDFCVRYTSDGFKLNIYSLYCYKTNKYLCPKKHDYIYQAADEHINDDDFEPKGDFNNRYYEE